MSNSAVNSDDDIVVLPESDNSMTSSASEKYGFESLEKPPNDSLQEEPTSNQQPGAIPLQCAAVITAQKEKEETLKETYSNTGQKDVSKDDYTDDDKNIKEKTQQSQSKSNANNEVTRVPQSQTSTGESETVSNDGEHLDVDQIGSVSSQAGFKDSQSDNRRLTSNATNELRRRPERRRVLNDGLPPGDNVNQPANNANVSISQLLIISVLILIIVVLCVYLKNNLIILFYLPTLPSPQEPVTEINTKRHVPPSSSSWKLVGRCKAYNSSYTIKHCEWRQVYPRPTSPQNTVLPRGTKDCLPKVTSHDIDATLDKLPVPSHRENYVFELSCTDNTGNTGRDSVNILMNELREPIVTVTADTLVIPEIPGIAKLEASCKAIQGNIEERKWIYLNGPGDKPILPSQDGFVQLLVPGVYKFQYQCKDCYGALGMSSSVTVEVRSSKPEIPARSPQKPIVEINDKKHVPPSSISWTLVASCRAHNSYTIQKCEWKQVYPIPTSPQNTVLPGGTKDCLPETTSRDIDATLDKLPVPRHRENYVFELSCTDNTGNTGRDSVNILMNELREPTVTVPTDTLVIPENPGIAKLEASCKANQGNIEERKWIYFNGPGDKPILPSPDGFVQLPAPGIYKFQCQCRDSYGGSALSSPVTVEVRSSKPEIPVRSPQKPIVKINNKKHVPPSSISWELVASCRAYDSYTIRKCEWKQVYPIPTSLQNTVLPGGTKDCLSETELQAIDATLNNLKVPDLRGSYKFQLSCCDNSGNTGVEHIEILINELIPPTITVSHHEFRLSTFVDHVKLQVSCKAVQGKIVKREWIYIDGPSSIDPIIPSDDDIFHFSMPGTYKFKYECKDSYNSHQQSSVIAVIVEAPRSPQGPSVEINTKKNVPPLSNSWKLVGRCKAYNSSYTIKQCEWKQIHPQPTSPENTVLPGGTKDCQPSESTTSSHDIDATIADLKVPSYLGSYIFELSCSDNTDNTGAERVDIWIKELTRPLITVTEKHYTVSTSIGNVTLEGTCEAVQGKIVSKEWVYIDGPNNIGLVQPSENGTVQFSRPGTYKFKFKCTDSYDGYRLSELITVTVKPPYVLGIDLGTSTTCIAIIKEDGNRQDIAIYDDNVDTDPCMPSVVAFSLSGELLVGEKAFQQAVINSKSTIYEVKRLMGRSYYDDANYKFAYKVRPTLKSHSLRGVRAAVEIPCGKYNDKLIQPELVSAIILRYVANHAGKYIGVPVKDVVISVPAQFDDAQRKATMDAGMIAGLNIIKIVNEPTVAAFAANNLPEKLSSFSNKDSAEDKRKHSAVWAVVADIGGGTTDYALMQIHGSFYKVITTDGNKTLGGRDIDIALAKEMTKIFEKKYGLKLTNTAFQQKLRLECEIAKKVLSERQQFSLTVEYIHDEHNEKSTLVLEHLLTRADFEKYISEILNSMVKPLDSLLARGKVGRGNIQDLYLVGGTSHIPKLKEKLLSYFNKVLPENVRHEDPVQLVSRGAAAFGAVLTKLVHIDKMPKIDAVPLPINIAVDMDKMHEIFERNRLYTCIEKRNLTTFTNNQNAIAIKVYEGEGKTADECHFLGEFELSGIPPSPKNEPKINATFKIDSNGILSVRASYGKINKAMKLDVYSKSGGMTEKKRDQLSLRLKQLMSQDFKNQARCEILEDATRMTTIPKKQNKSNVLKLHVDSEFESVKMAGTKANTVITMVAVKSLVTDTASAATEADLDIVLVVDISVSMNGRPFETMKNLMLSLISQLNENHRLGIITFAGNFFINFNLASCTEEKKKDARNIVRGLTTMCCSTNIYDALLTGLKIAYQGRKRSRVLLFTDGKANFGTFYENNDIIENIRKEIVSLSSGTNDQTILSTFGYLGNHDEYLLNELAKNVGGGTYNFLNEDTDLKKFGFVLGDAIYTVAEKIHLTITPEDGVEIKETITNFPSGKENETLSFQIPSTADQQSRHILLKLAVSPTQEQINHQALFHVKLSYNNAITNREEGGEEYLFVARTEHIDHTTRSRDVGEQLNRIHVIDQIEQALEALKVSDTEKAEQLLIEAYRKIKGSDSGDTTLSMCLSEDLEELISEVETGDLNTAKKSLQDSLTSHLQEKGGRNSCYVTMKEDKLISVLTSENATEIN